MGREKRQKKERQEREIDDFLGKNKGEDEKIAPSDDGLPFACYLCRGHFKDAVVTNCHITFV